ncbi:MAG: hypothetical protein RL535_1324 [Pseudomonadota bacterium]|jgi:heme/copper-type cytochrome/quinol oxidase subunit 4
MLNRFLITQFIGFVLAIALCTVADRAPYLFSEIALCSCVALLIWFFVDVGDFVFFSNNAKRFPFTKIRLAYATCAVFLAQVLGELICYMFLDFGVVRKQFNAIFVWFVIDVMVMFCFIWIMTQRQLRELDRQQTAEAQLRLLETQLEPHMVFNTLANLRALVNTNPAQGIEMLDHFVDYLRATAYGSRMNLHSLRTEFERLADYLEIMKVRMGSRLTYSLDFSDEIANILVPPFLLQPLLENAIKHGLEPKIGGGEIIVLAHLSGCHVAIEVNDSGVGCDIDYLNSGGSSGFGLTQVSQRLATAYGNEGSMQFLTSSKYATSVQITLPCKHANFTKIG